MPAALGPDVFRSDLLATGGLDDRTGSRGILPHAQRLMAEAVSAEHTFFSTCGSSLSVKAAMLAAAGPHEELLVGRDAHKSVVAGLIVAGIRPVRVDPSWDAGLHLAHPPRAEAFRAAPARHPDAKGALVTSPTPSGTRTARPEPPTTRPADIRATAIEAALRLLRDLLRPLD
ncbi:Orn/Lys/Arg decarboxylase-like protein [Kitasatospora sp. SolWspMP-SS2h]|nr:Orn/Lys/Arg decarboxylase-like protein [Kitasatospora sp. SolWspMP-SS2h]